MFRGNRELYYYNYSSKIMSARTIDCNKHISEIQVKIYKTMIKP